jgi:Flp pilus assembly pilin Flp
MFASWLRNERGVETVEWAAVAALIVAAALVVVTVEIGPGINDAGHLLRLLLVGIF